MKTHPHSPALRLLGFLSGLIERLAQVLAPLGFWRKYSSRRLAKIIEAHQLWFSSRQKQGSRAILSGAHLKGTSLAETDLRGADLSRASLAQSLMNMADLREADLAGADLSRADLSRTMLVGTNLANTTLKDCSIYPRVAQRDAPLK